MSIMRRKLTLKTKASPVTMNAGEREDDVVVDRTDFQGEPRVNDTIDNDDNEEKTIVLVSYFFENLTYYVMKKSEVIIFVFISFCITCFAPPL
jgi:hypothetical protein